MTKRSSSIDQVRESLRLQQIYNTISSYGLDMALDRGALGVFRRRMQGFIYQPGEEVEPLSIPVKVRLMLQELGPTYVKMGQIISSRAEVLPAEWMHELNKLQSNVPPFSSEEVREIITEELGDAPERLYQAFNPHAFRRRFDGPGPSRRAGRRHEGRGQGPAAGHPQANEGRHRRHGQLIQRPGTPLAIRPRHRPARA
jgi:hypothetical protein